LILSPLAWRDDALEGLLDDLEPPRSERPRTTDFREDFRTRDGTLCYPVAVQYGATMVYPRCTSIHLR